MALSGRSAALAIVNLESSKEAVAQRDGHNGVSMFTLYLLDILT